MKLDKTIDDKTLLANDQRKSVEIRASRTRNSNHNIAMRRLCDFLRHIYSSYIKYLLHKNLKN